MNIEITNYIHKHLTKTGHLIRDLQQALMLGGPVDEALERALIRIREACEDAGRPLEHNSRHRPAVWNFPGAKGVGLRPHNTMGIADRLIWRPNHEIRSLLACRSARAWIRRRLWSIDHHNHQGYHGFPARDAVN
jgi:hypothetical protein